MMTSGSPAGSRNPGFSALVAESESGCFRGVVVSDAGLKSRLPTKGRNVEGFVVIGGETRDSALGPKGGNAELGPRTGISELGP